MKKIIIYFYILAIGLLKKDIFFVSWNRISFLIILFSGILTFNSCSVSLFHTENVCLYNGLWQLTVINGGFSIFFISRDYSSDASQSIVPVKSQPHL